MISEGPIIIAEIHPKFKKKKYLNEFFGLSYAIFKQDFFYTQYTRPSTKVLKADEHLLRDICLNLLS